MSHSHGDHSMHGNPVAAVVQSVLNATVSSMVETTTAHHHEVPTTTMHHHMTTEHNHDDMGDMGNGTHHMMMMYFHFGNDETVLFEEWKIDSVGKMVGSVIGIFIMALLYEGLKYFRERLNRQNMVAVNYSTIKTGDTNVAISRTNQKLVCKTAMLSGSHFVQTALHLIQLILSYFLMLIVMTYNVWLCLAVVLGCTVGYFLFGWQKSYIVDITEHCH